MPLLLYLGYWQIQRAEQKQQTLDMLQARSKLAPISLNYPKNIPADFRYYSAEAVGSFDVQHQFLIDNKIYQHQAGYQVITPLVLAQSSQVLLVNRGWIAQGKNRNELPDISIINSPVKLRGILSLPDRVFNLGGENQNTVWPQRIQAIDVQKISRQLGRPVYPFILLLAPDQAYGFARNWQMLTMLPSKHYAYAFQWFALAATLLIIIIAINWRRKDTQ